MLTSPAFPRLYLDPHAPRGDDSPYRTQPLACCKPRTDTDRNPWAQETQSLWIWQAFSALLFWSFWQAQRFFHQGNFFGGEIVEGVDELICFPLQRGGVVGGVYFLRVENLGDNGFAWDIFGESLLQIITLLDEHSEVLRSGLAGDHVRVITKSNMKRQDLNKILACEKINITRIEQVEPQLEDVFLALATK
ncbi:MAG TPA: hypothetical protein G4N95_07750 [Anaerolineae bacterium]|nr:hypothetical protein [Anaerolineae bacterium]